MSYLEKNVISSRDVVKVIPKKNPISLILKWIWGVLGFWLIFIPTFQAIKATIIYCTTEYLVTNFKVLEKYGWISTHTDEMPLTKIENIVVEYSFLVKFSIMEILLFRAQITTILFLVTLKMQKQ